MLRSVSMVGQLWPEMICLYGGYGWACPMGRAGVHGCMPRPGKRSGMRSLPTDHRPIYPHKAEVGRNSRPTLT